MGKESIKNNTEWTIYKNMYIQKVTLTAFKKMQSDALKSSVKIDIVSAYRSFSHQKRIWDRKWNLEKYVNTSAKDRALDILRYSSMPGTSRHHWGTDIDITSVSTKFFTTAQGKKIYNWLAVNASKYGFHQPYTAGRDKGYADEPWHWSLSELSDEYTRLYLQTITNSDVDDHLANELDIIDGWVNLGESIRGVKP